MREEEFEPESDEPWLGENEDETEYERILHEGEED